MDSLRRTLLAAIALSPLAARSQPAANVPAYSTLQNPLPLEAQGKIEIAEFFWYGCIHCYNLEPLLERWVPALPADTQFRRIPAVFNERWAHDAAIYYAFEVLGAIDVGPDGLDGHGALQGRIEGLVDLAHAAAAEDGFDAKTAYGLRQRKLTWSHGIDLSRELDRESARDDKGKRQNAECRMQDLKTLGP